MRRASCSYGTEANKPTNKRGPASKCVLFQAEFCGDAGAFLEDSGATFITMTAAECAKWSVER